MTQRPGPTVRYEVEYEHSGGWVQGNHHSVFRDLAEAERWIEMQKSRWSTQCDHRIVKVTETREVVDQMNDQRQAQPSAGIHCWNCGRNDQRGPNCLRCEAPIHTAVGIHPGGGIAFTELRPADTSEVITCGMPDGKCRTRSGEGDR